ncbi:PulJ/GspJ family protein [Lacunisphaera limnophila]|uniref:PulJ/GspJ family protein n=1 Tax=Lacunisphaera limnophila TaxID=1838286 RepID=UPI0012FD0416|nr:type II secretion system protein [Lacunisphaera limnophila]
MLASRGARSREQVRSHKGGHAGFTLLELLVAVTITLLIAGLMLAVTMNVLTLWRRQQAKYTQAMTAKQVLDQLEQDLQAAVHRRDTTRWLAADILDSSATLANHGWLAGPGMMKPGGGGSLRPLPEPGRGGERLIEQARFGLSGVWLRCVTTNVESGGSLPIVVAWQMARRPVTGDPVAGNPAPVRYALYRSAISSEETLVRGYDVASGNYASSNNNPYAVGAAQFRLARNVMNPGHANLIASNVVDFGCWLYVRDGGGALVRIYPGAAGDLSHQAVGQSGANDSAFPVVADVLVRILSEEGAGLIEAMESGRVVRPADQATDAAWWWSVVEAHSAVFSRRIEIKGVAQ